MVTPIVRRPRNGTIGATRCTGAASSALTQSRRRTHWAEATAARMVAVDSEDRDAAEQDVPSREDTVHPEGNAPPTEDDASMLLPPQPLEH
jgi:hypothetical protein